MTDMGETVMNGWQMQPVYKLATLAEWVDELPLLDDLKLIDQEKQRVIAYWRRVPYEERDHQFLKECFYQYQADMVLMLDSLYHRSAEALSKALEKVLSALMACLEALLEFIERHRPQYFNTGQRLPECIRQRIALELEDGDQKALLSGGCTYAQLIAVERNGSAAINMGFEDDLPVEMTAEEEAMMARYLKVWGGFKMHIKVSVALFGMLLGTLINVKVMEPTSRERGLIMKFFAEHIRTDVAKAVSPNSLNNHSNSKDIRLLRAMITLCERMIHNLNEIIEKVLGR